MSPADGAASGAISEVLTHHTLTSIDSCSCGEMSYDPRLTGEEVAHQHRMHVERRIIDAGYIAASVHVNARKVEL